MKKILKTMIKSNKKIINIRMTDEERSLLEKKASDYCNGNRTALIVNAIKRFNPTKKELASIG